MTNTNLFRKGLATSAIAALGVSVLTGVAPASAVDPAVSLELTHGTSTNVKTWDFAELKAGFSLDANPFAQCGYYTGSGNDIWVTADCNYSVMPISYLVESLDGADVYATTYDGADDHGDYEPDSTGDYVANWNDLNDPYEFAENLTRDSMVLDGGRYHSVTNRIYLELDSDISKASRVRVTAFLDHNGDNEITAGTDESTAPVTITFNRPEDLSAVTTLTQPIVGDDDLNASTTISPVLNDDFTRGPGDVNGPWGADMVIDFTVENYEDNSDQNGHNLSTVDFGTYSDGVYTAYESEMYNGTLSLFNAQPGNYEAQLFVYGEAVGNIDRKVVAARHFNDARFSFVEGNDVNYDTTDYYTADYFDYVYTGDYAEVRAGSGAQTITVTSYDDEGNFNPAGTKLNLLVDHLYNWQSTGDFEVKVNGAAVEEGDKVELTVGADGKATFTVQNTGDEREASYDEAGFLVESVDGNWRGSYALYIGWEPAQFDSYDLNGDQDSDFRNIGLGQSYTFDLGFDDQFGQAPANGLYRLVASGSGRVAFDSKAVNIVNGRAPLTITDNGSTTPQERDGFVNMHFEKLVNVGTELYPNNVWLHLDAESIESYEDGDHDSYATKYYVQDAGSIAVDADNDTLFVQAAPGAFLGNFDNRFKRNTNTEDITLEDMVDDYDLQTELAYVNVDNAITSINRVGAKVTFSAPGFQFQDNAARDKISEGSISVFTNENGDTSVRFAAHTKGTHTLTITSGSVTKTVTVIVDNLAAANVAVSQVANAQAGKSLVTTATVTDKWGNSVDEGAVTFASTVGHFDATSVNLDDNGVASSTLFVEADDLGTATVTATAGEAVGTATTTFGVTDGHVFKNKKRVTATWEFAKGKTVAIYRDGRRVRNIPVATDDAGKFSFNVKKGKHNVTLKIAGVVVYSYTFNVK